MSARGRPAETKLIYINEAAECKHLAAWHESDLFTKDLRASFRSVCSTSCSANDGGRR